MKPSGDDKLTFEIPTTLRTFNRHIGYGGRA